MAAALLSLAPTRILGVGRSQDEQVARNLIEAMGARVKEIHADYWEITPPASRLSFPPGPYFFGESGLSARLFIPILSLGAGPYYLDGAPGLRARPMDPLKQILESQGIGWKGGAGLPAQIHGRFAYPKTMEIEGSLSSQFLSGWLFALAFSCPHPIEVEAPGLQSVPYVDMSLEVLEAFGHPVERLGGNRFLVPAWEPQSGEKQIQIEGDWSAAANFLVAGLVAGSGPMHIQGLNPDSAQADRALVPLIQSLGARIQSQDHGMELIPGPNLSGFDFDCRSCPDLFPILAILAACARGSSRIQGLGRLIHKESNRAQSISAMLTAFGVAHRLEEDQLVVQGGNRLQGARVQSFHDHRIVMAASIGALMADGPTEIHGAESVAKSYPGFFDQIQRLGARVQTVKKST